MLKLRIIQTFTRRGNYIIFPLLAYWWLFLFVCLSSVIAYSIQLDTALDCQGGEECLLWITSQKGKQKLVSGERECAVLLVWWRLYINYQLKFVVILFRLFELSYKACNVPNLCSQRPAFGRQIVKNGVDSMDIVYHFPICWSTLIFKPEIS